MSPKIPRYIVWSTDPIDLDDPFQKRWLLRQTLMYGRAVDIRKLDFGEIERELDDLHLPPEVDSLWPGYFQSRPASDGR